MVPLLVKRLLALHHCRLRLSFTLGFFLFEALGEILFKLLFHLDKPFIRCQLCLRELTVEN